MQIAGWILLGVVVGAVLASELMWWLYWRRK
jgi:hypothetical protein